MTRINLVDPRELMDQHLFAEFREIKMVAKALARSLKTKPKGQVLATVPPKFTLGTGHVRFFYNKGGYLQKRYALICQELAARGVDFNREARCDPDGVMSAEFAGDWEPTAADLEVIRERIAQRISEKPGWYRKTVPKA
ncbi:endonuclease V N-glycosylase UV repair enzyme [Acidovorax phage ACP17]|uniref:Endonuclease V n=1 Tax=Acidovorax phage ACP17 TaxID=2010329 RepID=A0A218M3C5_9CAUD|nr:endonuclease V N-glycosylase UV repair enzyme [Acidovorax phage ACP17]ASD50552.1 endonuclease V [Acidovorax phage ACP17]